MSKAVLRLASMLSKAANNQTAKHRLGFYHVPAAKLFHYFI